MCLVTYIRKTNELCIGADRETQDILFQKDLQSWLTHIYGNAMLQETHVAGIFYGGVCIYWNDARVDEIYECGSAWLVRNIYIWHLWQGRLPNAFREPATGRWTGSVFSGPWLGEEEGCASSDATHCQ